MEKQDKNINKSKIHEQIYIGVDYYPEHWAEERWPVDAAMMQTAGFNIVRMAEFAWAMLEPQEGNYCLDWLDRAIDILGNRGISVILGTPTASPPPWLHQHYPDSVRTTLEGRKANYGLRQTSCFSSENFNRLSIAITRAMAEHFANCSQIVGWQIDNEFTAPLCYCERCRQAFQDWLRAKYGSLQRLNQAWGTHFWNHIYGEWSEIPLSLDANSDNPSLYLDWRRFASDNVVRFQREQIEILREICPRHAITHNLMGLAQGVNYFDLARDLDFVSWDHYPVHNEPDLVMPAKAALAADLMRGTRLQNFWIMEQAAGPLGWGAMRRNLRPGELRKMVWQQVAHGADGILWFRWRSCTAGREQYWHGLLGHDGKAGRRYHEAAQTASELHRLWPLLKGTTVKPKVALIYDYDSLWAFTAQPAYDANKSSVDANRSYYADALLRFHTPLQMLGINADVIGCHADFNAYRVIIAPHLYVLSAAAAQRLQDFVRDGGILVTDVRTAVKDETSLITELTPPGFLRQVLGIEIPEYESIAQDYPITGCGPLTGEFTATAFGEWILAKEAKILAQHGAWYCRDYAALTVNEYGQGAAYHVGVVVKENEFYRRLLQEVCRRAQVLPIVEPPPGVEAVVRELDGRQLLFLINHTEEPKSLNLPLTAKRLIGKSMDELCLEAFAVEVVQL